MAIILKDKNGNLLTRPVTHPATDAQVYEQLSRLNDEGALILPTEDFEPRIKSLEDDVYGQENKDTPTLVWTIGMMNEQTGEETSDTEKMRIRTQKIFAEYDMTIHFANTSKYKYQCYRYDLNGEYDGYDVSWMSVADIHVERGWSVIVKVRENNYATWNDTNISTFAATVTVSYENKEGLLKRMDDLEDVAENVKKISESVRQNTNSIVALKNSIESIGGSTGDTTLLMQYNDNAFPNLEYGEISWESGLNVGNSNRYARSTDYLYVNSDDAVFVANVPSTTMVSFYAYTSDGSTYSFVGPSPWMWHGNTYKPEKGKYYRVLYLDESSSGINLAQCKVILSGSALSDIIKGLQNKDGSDLLNESLSTAEQIEMEETSASIKANLSPHSALIAFFTDLHLECGSANTTSGTNINRTKKHLTMYNKLAKRFDFDMLLFGGDYLQNSSATVKANAEGSLSLLKTFIGMTDHSAPIAVIKGNHDDNTMHTDYKNGYVSDDQRWMILQDADHRATIRDAERIEHAYGYYDIPNQKIRVFFLNTIDIPTKLNEENNTIEWPGQGLTGFSGEQIQFVADHLRFDEDGWQVIFFSHHPIKRNPFPSPMANVGVTAANGGSIMQAVLQGFKNKDSGSIDNVTNGFRYTITYDFSQNKSNTIIACVNGHTHYDCAVYQDGINWIATRAIDGHATYGFKDTSIYIIIDRSKQTISFIANGEGENRTYIYE